jgi:nucleoside-diphosphate-sugar epimerase
MVSMIVLILGAGYTGTELARQLQQQGISVRLTTRTGQSLPDLSAPVVQFIFPVAGEGSQSRGGKASSLGALAGGLPAAALAGVTHVVSTIAPTDKGLDPVYHGILAQLQSISLQWFGYLSTTGVYGDTQGAWVDELSPVAPAPGRSQVRQGIEQALLSSGLPTHVFRLPGIYGPGRSIFDRIRAGTAQNIVKPGHVFCRIHVADIAQTLICSMMQPAPGNVYNVVDDLPAEPSELLCAALDLMGLTPPPPIPFDSVQLSPMAASFWRECRRVSNQKIKTELGVRLTYPSFHEGLYAIFQAETIPNR